MKKLLLASILLTACGAVTPYVNVRGQQLTVTNPTDRYAVAKVTCSRRIFDGDYDRFFVLEPYSSKNVEAHCQHVLICAVESVEYKTPAEIALEVQPDRRRR